VKNGGGNPERHKIVYQVRVTAMQRSRVRWDGSCDKTATSVGFTAVDINYAVSQR